MLYAYPKRLCLLACNLAGAAPAILNWSGQAHNQIQCIVAQHERLQKGVGVGGVCPSHFSAEADPDKLS